MPGADPRGKDLHTLAPSSEEVIGRRIRQIRSMRGLSQSQLAEQLGISFQQVQKYESGKNRISAGRLWDIARVLQAPIASFFHDLSDTVPGRSEPVVLTEDGPLAGMIGRIDDREVRDALAALLAAYHKSRSS